MASNFVSDFESQIGNINISDDTLLTLDLEVLLTFFWIIDLKKSENAIQFAVINM